MFATAQLIDPDCFPDEALAQTGANASFLLIVFAAGVLALSGWLLMRRHYRATFAVLAAGVLSAATFGSNAAPAQADETVLPRDGVCETAVAPVPADPTPTSEPTVEPTPTETPAPATGSISGQVWGDNLMFASRASIDAGDPYNGRSTPGVREPECDFYGSSCDLEMLWGTASSSSSLWPYEPLFGQLIGEAPISVVLIDADGNEMQRTQLNEQGTYLFENVPVGEGYTVDFQFATSKDPNADSVTVYPNSQIDLSYLDPSFDIKDGVDYSPHYFIPDADGNASSLPVKATCADQTWRIDVQPTDANGVSMHTVKQALLDAGVPVNGTDVSCDLVIEWSTWSREHLGEGTQPTMRYPGYDPQTWESTWETYDESPYPGHALTFTAPAADNEPANPTDGFAFTSEGTPSRSRPVTVVEGQTTQFVNAEVQYVGQHVGPQ